MKEFEGKTNQVLTTISGMIKAVYKEKKPMFIEINEQIIIIAPAENVRWKREPERILDNNGTDAIEIHSV